MISGGNSEHADVVQRAGDGAPEHVQVQRTGARTSAASGLRAASPDRRTRRLGGFTLLELLVVMVIIGLLAAYVAPRYFSQVGRSEVRSAQAQIAALRNALDTYRLDVGSYPTPEQGLVALNVKPPSAARWNGPYLRKSVPVDPWGHPYQYKAPGEHGEFDLFSLGKDGQPGGSGDGADITSWQ